MVEMRTRWVMGPFIQAIAFPRGSPNVAEGIVNAVVDFK